jgi:hypothetical protein
VVAKEKRPLNCPCSSGLAYTACCGRYHQGAPAPNAEALMRSRYTAYVMGHEDYLLANWHPPPAPPASTSTPLPNLNGSACKSSRINSRMRSTPRWNLLLDTKLMVAHFACRRPAGLCGKGGGGFMWRGNRRKSCRALPDENRRG